MPTLNPHAQKFQQLLALAGLAQQQETSQNSLQQQLALHQMGLQQQQNEAAQMAAWRQMQAEQASKQEADRSGEFWGGTLPMEYQRASDEAAYHKSVVDQQQTQVKALAATEANRVGELAATEANRVGEFWGGTLPAEYARTAEMAKQRQDTGALSVADSLFRLGKDEQGRAFLPDYLQPKVQQLHQDEVSAEVRRYGPILTAPGMTSDMQKVLMSSIGPKVHPDVLSKLQGMIAPPTQVAAPVVATPAPVVSVTPDQTPLLDINSREGIRRNPAVEALLRAHQAIFNSATPTPYLPANASPQDYGYPN